MNAAEEAIRIVEAHVPVGVPIDRHQIEDAIRWAIVRAVVEAKQPPELAPSKVSPIVNQILFFIHQYVLQLRSAPYRDQANALQECMVVVRELALVEPGAAVPRKLAAIAERVAG